MLLSSSLSSSSDILKNNAFPGRLGVKTSWFHGKEHGFNPWLGELRSCTPQGMAKKNEYNSKNILLIAKCLVSQISVVLYSVSQSIELQGISYLAVLPKAHNKVAIFVPSFKKTFYNRMIGIIGRWRPRKNSELLNLIFHHCYHLDIPSLFPSHYSLRGGKKTQLSYGSIFNYSVEKKGILFQVNFSSK